MFRDVADRVRGTVFHALRDQIAADIDQRVCDLLDEAITRWEASGWTSSDLDEDDCTVQIYKWCLELAHENGRFACITPIFNWIFVEESMFAGVKKAKTAKRPDLRITVGKSVGRAIECKRLALSNGLPKKYVDEGLARFVVGEYAPDESVGYMIGYAKGSSFAALVKQINGHIDNHTSMGQSHRLNARSTSAKTSWHRSHHDRKQLRPIDVNHLLVAVA